jgi:hypothetical protein
MRGPARFALMLVRSWTPESIPAAAVFTVVVAPVALTVSAFAAAYWLNSFMKNMFAR